MIRITRITHALAALAATLLLSTAQAQDADDSLYRAWGEKAGIQAVMQDFVTRLQADARMAPFFKNANREHLVTQLTEQLCQQAGGPCTYKGVPMKEAHESMDIGRRDFNALVEVLQQSMQAKGIPFAAQNAMLARLAPMHRDIINRP
ncbi:MAG: group 1 truncated hemoglobin [Methylotenera sp.]|jgi:hemoglobin|nr:group 1 truncated hemoglobin [Methylotenera sp.]